MSVSEAGAGGRLVVLDRLGRAMRSFALHGGLATLGCDQACDIRVMQPEVAPHHATIAVHNAQTVIRNVEGAATLVNGAPVSVAALRHRDVITVADRNLRWEYDDPTGQRQPRGEVANSPGRVLAARAARAQATRRTSEGAGRAAALRRDRTLHLALEMGHRTSMPGSSGGKQVAIVQPQRRDTSQQIVAGVDRPKAPTPVASPMPPHTTQATLWIERRKTSPRRATSLHVPSGSTSPSGARRARRRTAGSLRMAVLKRGPRPSAVKIQAPLAIDYTKQAAIMLMTGHTKSKLSKSLSYVVKKPSPVRNSRRGRKSALAATTRHRSTGNRSMPLMERTVSASPPSLPSISISSNESPQKSPGLPSPKKSALKDTSKKTIRKIESIKFDLTNLENHRESDVVLLSENTKYSNSNFSDGDMTLYYSESPSPSPRRSIHSRSSRMLESLGSNLTLSPSRTLTPQTPQSPSTRKSTRNSLIVQKALDGSLGDYTKSDHGRTRTLSPRNMESYSVVDLVSADSTEASVYNSADSTVTSASDYGSPATSVGRKKRSTLVPNLPASLASSTPYRGGGDADLRQTRSKSNLTNVSNMSIRKSKSNLTNASNLSNRKSKSNLTNASNLSVSRSKSNFTNASNLSISMSKSNLTNVSNAVSTRRSKSLTTPENSTNISVKSARVSRRSRSRSRIYDSELVLLDDTEPEASPKTSRRARSTKSIGDLTEQTTNEGMSTPENRRSPDEVGTPVLSIQSLLDSSQSSLLSQTSSKKRRAFDSRRKTIAVAASETRLKALRPKANRSLCISAKKTIFRLSRGSSRITDKKEEGLRATPESAFKPVPEEVKNKHSTAKKPQSKRSLIDDLDRSDMIKQLFNSPVKRKLSQSITEFSNKLSSDEEDTDATYCSSTKKPSPNTSGVRRLFKKQTPQDDFSDLRGLRSLLRTPRTRRSIKNDLTNVSGVKAVFARSPRNRLSDVRVKEVFATGPENDLRRVSGVKNLFRENKSPKNDLTNIRSVKQLFAKRSPRNDLRNLSGVKDTLRRNTPKNDLTDLRGVKKMFNHQKRRSETVNLSGVEELFDESTPSVSDSEALFDRFIGKPVTRKVYSKTLPTKTPNRNRRHAKSLHASIDVITTNVEEWLEEELQKRLHKDDTAKSKVTKELQKLATETVQGEEPIRLSRTRNSSMKKSVSETYSALTLPLKKRSLAQVYLESSTNNLLVDRQTVEHSTPVKGRINAVMNASELGRVSPIAFLDHTKDNIRSTRQMPTVEDKTTKRTTRAVKKPTSPKPSPKQPEEPPPTMKPRNRNAKKRNSLVIAKKPPVMSPKATNVSSLKRTRSTRAKTRQIIEAPKTRNTRAQKSSVAVSLDSGEGLETTKPTQSKPRRGKQPETEEKVEKPVPKRTRKAAAQTESLPASPVVAPKRTRKGKQDLPTATTEENTTTRSKKVEIEIEVETSTKSKRGRKNVEVPEEKPVNEPPKLQTRRQRARAETLSNTQANSASSDTLTKGRKRKAAASEEITSGPSKRKATLSKSKKDESSTKEESSRSRRKVQFAESPAAAISTRGKRSTTRAAQPTVTPQEVVKRKTQSTALAVKEASPVASPVRKTKSAVSAAKKKASPVASPVRKTKSATSAAKKKASPVVSPVRKTKSAASAAKNKASPVASPVRKTKSATSAAKKKASPVASPVRKTKSAVSAAKKKASPVVSPVRKTRSRAVAAGPAAPATSRSRRR